MRFILEVIPANNPHYAGKGAGREGVACRRTEMGLIDEEYISFMGLFVALNAGIGISILCILI